MNTERWRRIRELFEASLDLPEDEQEEFVGVAASAEPEIRDEVLRMLEADREESSIVHVAERAAQEGRPSPEVALLAQKPPESDVQGTRIGSYSLRRPIASGGMGTVYEAEQERPQRRVALKMLRIGLTSPSALRRFQYESEVLAKLRHPGIAQVYEAGTHTEEVGPQTLETPWYAMEFVEGARPVVAFANDGGLSTEERVQLFLQVIDAVHYGHQKGVIHRDIKPGNILVDASGRVKIIDFGIARATNTDDVRATLQTEAGEILGTLQYMSPEQLDFESDVDTRTDVYALGMVLYELLCHRLPYDIGRMAIHEAARVIRDEQPERPSTILRALSGDLEAICLMALEKEPRRRYASAEAFGADLRRFLAREPIEARFPSVAYQLSMFARRNRALVVAAAAIVLVLIAATTVSVDYAIEAARANKEARDERDDAVLARDAEARERSRAELAERAAEERLVEVQEESRKASAVSDYLAELLSTAHPGNVGRDALVTDLLKRARVEVGPRFAEWPDVRAELRGVLGTTYLGLGLVEEGEAEVRRALATLDETGVPEDSDQRIELEFNLAAALYRRGSIAEAETILDGLLEKAERVFGPDHRLPYETRSSLAVLRTEQARYEEAESLHREAIEGLTRIQGADALGVTDAVERYTVLLLLLDRLDEAEPLMQGVLETRRARYGPNHVSTFAALENVAALLRRRGDLEGAIQHYRDLVKLTREHLGEEHDQTLTSVSVLADTLRETGRLTEAEPLARLALELHVRKFGEKHHETPSLLHSLAGILQTLSKFEEAEAVYRSAYELSVELLGPDTGRTHMSGQNLASILWLQGKTVEAEPIARDAVAGLARAFGDENVLTLRARSQHACMLWRIGEYQEALELIRATIEAQTRVRGESDLDRLQSLNYLAQFLRESGEFEEAARLLAEALEHQSRIYGNDHPETLLSVLHLMLLFEQTDDIDEATELARELVRGRVAVFGERNIDVLTAKDSLARFLREYGRPEEALSLLEEITTLAPDVLSPDHPLVFRFRVHLADCLVRLARYAEAEPHALEGLAGIELLTGPTNPVTLHAAGVVAELYRAWGRPEDAARFEVYPGGSE